MYQVVYLIRERERERKLTAVRSIKVHKSRQDGIFNVSKWCRTCCGWQVLMRVCTTSVTCGSNGTTV